MWQTSGPGGYATPAVREVLGASEHTRKSKFSNKWACWLRCPYYMGGANASKQKEKIRSGPHLGMLATSSVLAGRSRTL